MTPVTTAPSSPARTTCGPFTGLLAYPITPLADDGALDLDLLARLVVSAADAGVDAVTVLASSGAGTSFTADERRAVVRTAVAAAGGVPVHACVSASSTRATLRLARDAADEGAAGLVLAPFSYVPLVDDEVEHLFHEVSAATGLPLCFYNKPLQTGFDVSGELLARLAATTTVTAVKDPGTLPSRPHGRVADLRAATSDAPGFSIGISGDVAILVDGESDVAWHTGLAGLLPAEYAAIRSDTVTGAQLPGDTRRWLVEVAEALAGTRPVSGLHALARALGIRTGPPRGPSLPASRAQHELFASLVGRRPGSGSRNQRNHV